uniref:CHAD domain-containing protein n=1 Tax=Nitratifractor sp. TaxID=2268144 RepID=UPI0025F28486
PEAYHKVRIEAKKLRYMLELFASILEPGAYEATLKQVKKIQEILGEHQDFMVQLTYLESLEEQEKLSDEEREAIDYLYRHLYHRAKKRRKEFRKKRQWIENLNTQLKEALCRI